MKIKNKYMNYSSGNTQRFQSQSVQPQSVQSSQSNDTTLAQNISPVSARLFDWVITVSLVAIFAGVPLFFTSMTMQGILFDKVMYFYFWTLLALVSWAAKGAILGKLRFTRTPLDWPILAVLAVATISTVFSIDWWQSFWGSFGDPSRGLFAMLMMTVLYYIIVDHFSMTRFRWMFGGLLFSGSVVSIWTFLGLLNVPFLPQAIIAQSPLSLLGSFSSLAIFLSMMVPILVTGIFMLWSSDDAAQEGRIWRTALSVVLGGALIVTMLNLLSLFNYVIWSAVVVGTFFLLMYVLAHVVRPAKSLIWLPMVVVVVVAGFLMIGGSDKLVRVGQLPIEVTQDLSLSWGVAYSAIKENLLIGTGPATYEYVYTLNRPEYLNKTDFFGLRLSNGSNVVLNALATMGVLGAIVVIIVILTFLGVIIYLLSRDKERNKVASLGLVSASLILLVASMLGFGGNPIIGGIVAALTLAIVFAQSSVQLQRIEMSLTVSPKFALTMAFISIVVITGVGAGFFYVGKVFLADAYAGKAVRATEVNQDTAKYLLNAQSLHPRESRYAMRLGQEYAVLANRELLKSAEERNVDNLRKYLQLSQQFALLAKEQSPNDIATALAYAGIVENQGYYAGLDNPAAVISASDAVQGAYKSVQEIDPLNPTYFVKLGEWELRRAGALLKQEKKDEAKKSLNKAEELFGEAIAKKEVYPTAYYQRSQVREALENLDGAIEDAQTAVTQTGNRDMTAVFNLGRLYQARGTKDDQARAEIAFRSILGVNDKEVNALFSLATLYEQAQYYSEAITQYKAVMDLLPEEDAQTRERIQKLIDNIRGKANVVAPVQAQSDEEVVTSEELPANNEGGNNDSVAPAESTGVNNSSVSDLDAQTIVPANDAQATPTETPVVN